MIVALSLVLWVILLIFIIPKIWLISKKKGIEKDNTSVHPLDKESPVAPFRPFIKAKYDPDTTILKCGRIWR